MICTVEGQARRGIVGFLPIALLPGDAVEIVAALRAIVGAPVAAS